MYLHSDIYISQQPKHRMNVCGDVIEFYRDSYATTIVLCDGLGSGIKANIAANLYTARILELVKRRVSLREIFRTLVNTMNKIWGKDMPFSMFMVARILSNGETSVLSYEMPTPIAMQKSSVSILPVRTITIGKALISETNCSLRNGDSLLLFSDGITMAGIGKGMVNGWTEEGIERFFNDRIIHQDFSIEHLSETILDKAVAYCKKEPTDDCSVVLAHLRNGIIINILSGPPSNKDMDKQLIDNFLSKEGIKIICGGATAKLAAREMKKSIIVQTQDLDEITPPKYKIEGINLVTEGVVTLNQVYNLIDDPIPDGSSPVFELLHFLNNADRVNFITGDARNVDAKQLVFKQKGILQRNKIIPLIAKKLEEKGKLVNIEGI